MKQVRNKKEYGVWYYTSYQDSECEFRIYQLYDSNKIKVLEFASYGTMKEYIETGVIS